MGDARILQPFAKRLAVADFRNKQYKINPRLGFAPSAAPTVRYCTKSTNSSRTFDFCLAEMAEKFSFDLRRIKKNTLVFLCDM